MARAESKLEITFLEVFEENRQNRTQKVSQGGAQLWQNSKSFQGYSWSWSKLLWCMACAESQFEMAFLGMHNKKKNRQKGKQIRKSSGKSTMAKQWVIPRLLRDGLNWLWDMACVEGEITFPECVKEIVKTESKIWTPRESQWWQNRKAVSHFKKGNPTWARLN